MPFMRFLSVSCSLGRTLILQNTAIQDHSKMIIFTFRKGFLTLIEKCNWEEQKNMEAYAGSGYLNNRSGYDPGAIINLV